MKTLVLLTAVALGPCAVAQTTFTSIGDITFGSDGSTATTIGGTTFVTGASPVTYQASRSGSMSRLTVGRTGQR